MAKFLLKIIIIYCSIITFSLSEIIRDVVVEGNNRISKQTIITYGNIKLNTNYDNEKINDVLKNLYSTNFFENISITKTNDNLKIIVKENKIIQTTIIEGVKSNTIKKSILDTMYSKDKAPFLERKVSEDINRIKSSINNLGYYFADIESQIIENNNDTIDLIININLGEKASIGKIEFIGDKKFKDRTLRNVIISEENKFWKFISKNKFINQNLIERDKRLLENFYLNRGYYDVKIESTNANFQDNDKFKLVYKINSGKQYIINDTKLILPIDYDPANFQKLKLKLSELSNEIYSFSKISSVVEEIDKISLSREYDFINAEVIEKKVADNKIDIEFLIKESDKFYIERINIFGNNITQENVIRNSLEIDEGDPFNELLNAKSMNNLKSLNIFKEVKSKITDGDKLNTKVIDIEVTEKPTGEITLGAGVGSEGGSIGFGVTENNFLGKGVKLGSSLRVSEDTIRGNFSVTNPNFNYSNKMLISSVESTKIDKLADNGYETTKTGFSFGTRYEQYEDVYFSPSLSTYLEDLTTSNKASASLKKQSGNYFETKFTYGLDLDKRNQKFQTFDGHRISFYQGLPLISDEYALSNSVNIEKWYKFENEMVANFGVYTKIISSLNDEDVRITDRLTLPRSKLRGFKFSSIGPVDGDDYVGGNYAASINFDTTLPMILPSFETIDFKYFIDFGNVWGVDYSDSIDDSNKIRSSTGVSVDWFTPIGPLNFSLAQDISKASTDKTEGFQFNLGTTF
ncbi:outer membrane protein assembly factor BamA [Candidatus Pelagibacter sp.]|jgi:outer membrane protein insertion porin family|nr:outer membrane protein assembly factor BamA [Candidatus Pelagibacter sp.]